MSRELTPEEKRFIESEFVARQKRAAERRAQAQRVFLVGVSAGLVAGFLRGIELRSWFLWLATIVWLFSIVIYAGGSVMPLSLQKDSDIRWHLNPWRDALQSLSDDKTMKEAIALLAAPFVAQLVASFILWSFR
jgi:hypothetical protein